MKWQDQQTWSFTITVLSTIESLLEIRMLFIDKFWNGETQKMTEI